MTTAREIMSPDVEIIDGGATVAEAARRLAESDIGALPVCDADQRITGVVTDRDIVVQVVATGKNPEQTALRDVIEKTEVVTIGADDSVDEAVRTMKDKKVRRLPVIDGHRVIGMVSQGDLASNIPEDQVGDLVRAISSAP
jgi:CBS domain-containing protein